MGVEFYIATTLFVFIMWLATLISLVRSGGHPAVFILFIVVTACLCVEVYALLGAL